VFIIFVSVFSLSQTLGRAEGIGSGSGQAIVREEIR